MEDNTSPTFLESVFQRVARRYRFAALVAFYSRSALENWYTSRPGYGIGPWEWVSEASTAQDG